MRRLWIAALVAGCASGPQRSGTQDVAVAALRDAPATREVARAAPDAYAELAQALARAQAAPPSTRDDALEDARLTLAWAQDRLRVALARDRAVAASRRAEASDEETRRAEQQAAEINAALDRAEAERASRDRAEAAHARPASVGAAERGATAADLRQQAALHVAAARLLGADDPSCARVSALLDAAERAGRGADVSAALVAAGRAYVAAEALVTEARRDGRARRGDAGTDAAAVLGALSDAGGHDPHRDARGVIAVLRGLFAGSALSPTSRARVRTLANVIRGQEGARVRVEVFVGGPAAAAARAQSLANTLRDALIAQGVPAAQIEAQGLRAIPGAARGDDRVEVVLVTP